MNKALILVIVVVVVVAGAMLLSQQRKEQAPTGTQTQQKTPTKTSLEIKNFAFSPQTLSVKAGEEVSVTNKDITGHTVTSDDGVSFGTELIGKDQTLSFTVPSEPGTYPFHCTPHPNMKGSLVVE